MKHAHHFDVIITGGSYAGLSAAMALGRSLRKVLIIDSALPCNRQTPHSHNFITQDGEAPGVIAAKAREQVLNYSTITFLNDLVVSGKKSQNGFAITTQNGQEFEASKLIFATGLKDRMPEIKGFAQCWGISVVHCPYCHGYELRHKKTAILATGEKALHLASLVSNLSTNITVLTSGKAEFTAEQKQKIEKHNIPVIETEVLEIEHEKGQLTHVLFKDGSKLDFEGVYASLPFEQHSTVPASLGCQLTDLGYISIDAFQKTNVRGVYACGDNSSMMRSVANAVYTGNVAGAMVNKELTDEQF